MVWLKTCQSATDFTSLKCKRGLIACLVAGHWCQIFSVLRICKKHFLENLGWLNTLSIDIPIVEIKCSYDTSKIYLYWIRARVWGTCDGNMSTVCLDNARPPEYPTRIGNGASCCSSYTPGPRLNINTVFPRYGDYHVKDKTVVRPSYLQYGDSYTGKATSLYCDGPQFV